MEDNQVNTESRKLRTQFGPMKGAQAAQPDKYAIMRVERCLKTSGLIAPDDTVKHATISDPNIVIENSHGDDRIIKTAPSIRGIRSDKRSKAMDCRFESIMP